MNHTGGYNDHAFVAAFYDHIAPHRDRQDVDFFVQAAQEAGGAVLEVGCGTGSSTVALAEQGAAVNGNC